MLCLEDRQATLLTLSAPFVVLSLSGQLANPLRSNRSPSKCISQLAWEKDRKIDKGIRVSACSLDSRQEKTGKAINCPLIHWLTIIRHWSPMHFSIPFLDKDFDVLCLYLCVIFFLKCLSKQISLMSVCLTIPPNQRIKGKSIFSET